MSMLKDYIGGFTNWFDDDTKSGLLMGAQAAYSGYQSAEKDKAKAISDLESTVRSSMRNTNAAGRAQSTPTNPAKGVSPADFDAMWRSRLRAFSTMEDSVSADTKLVKVKR